MSLSMYKRCLYTLSTFDLGRWSTNIRKNPYREKQSEQLTCCDGVCERERKRMENDMRVVYQRTQVKCTCVNQNFSAVYLLFGQCFFSSFAYMKKKHQQIFLHAWDVEIILSFYVHVYHFSISTLFIFCAKSLLFK